MFHFLFHIFLQVITLPTSIDDLKTWLLVPAVMGVIATFFVNLYLSAAPDSLKQYANVVRLVVYILIAFLTVELAKIPPSTLDVYQPLFVAIMAAIAAFIGDTVLRNTGNIAYLAGHTLVAIGLRLAFGRTAAHESFKGLVAHG